MGAFLFLPMSKIVFPLPLLPDITKGVVIAYGLLLGELISNKKLNSPLKLSIVDLPMLLFCIAVPLASSLSNGLGLYDGIVSIINNYLTYGVLFWAGRRYFNKPEDLRALTIGMVYGGLICVPLVIFEVRMSPQLHTLVYGFFQHSFLQHFRQGGFRPILFMSHGLMVALWMSITTTLCFWLWQSRSVKYFWKIPAGPTFFLLAISTILCKSAGAISFMLIGISSYFVYRRQSSFKHLKWLILLIPIYLYFRISNLITASVIESMAGNLFSDERVSSLMVRIMQEDLFGDKAALHPLFGWGWMDRAWPVDPGTGEVLVQMVDAFWIIIFSTKGFFGLITIYLALGFGSYSILFGMVKPNHFINLKSSPYKVDAVVLSIVITIFLYDTLLNGMVTPIYILCTGALTSCYTNCKTERFSETYTEEISINKIDIN
ncbi:hypothetical protein [Spirochaeta isovalerica]|uniref:O-antigen ligase like membrane protein n=1 Tax=Spirochaeta isovalerica TaxID=150 RepID=A0A841R9Y6_9SPIO|nr:hypothetical protein [Spirochaeta isovalerica]MBB6479262.1 hypothetical protein [Spirochaeta isovalerica]